MKVSSQEPHEPWLSTQGQRVTAVEDLLIVTDRLDYSPLDQVLPLFDEQQFFLDELSRDKLSGASALEVGVGSGVLSIAVARAGARHVTALEINPRARRFAAFNIAQNHVAHKVTVLAGDARIYQPVDGRRFDYIFSNPPFMPTPPGVVCHLHSDAGVFGLDVLDALFQGLDAHLTEAGRAQIVTGAPGDADGPSLLVDLIQRRLRGAAKVIVSPLTVPFEACMGRLTAHPAAGSQVDALRRQAAHAGMTRFYLCVLHYDRTPGPLQVLPAGKAYDLNRLLPSTEAVG